MERTFEEEVIERLAGIEASLKSRAELCDIHKSDLASMRKDLDGNGKKGIKQELIDLKQEFIRFEAKVLAYSTIGAGLGSAVITIGVRYLIK